MNDTAQITVKNDKRPMALTILAFSIFGLSLAALLKGILADGALNLFLLLYVVAAVGLLKYRNGWRKFVLITATFLVGMLVIFAPWALLNVERIVVQFPGILGIFIDDRPHEVESWFTVALALLANAAVLGWVFWVLLRRDIRAMFVSGATNKFESN